MIEIIIGDIRKIDANRYATYLEKLPLWMRENVLKYRVQEDRYRTLLGKIILLDYLQKHTQYNLENIYLNKFKKPYLQNTPFHFSISHSGNFTVVIFAKTIVGIDIEKVNYNITLNDYKEIFLPKELNMIENSKDKIKQFYKIWTIKEAILKAHGDGFMRNPKEVLINDTKAYCENVTYNIHSFEYYEYILAIAYEKDENIVLDNFNMTHFL